MSDKCFMYSNLRSIFYFLFSSRLSKVICKSVFAIAVFKKHYDGINLKALRSCSAIIVSPISIIIVSKAGLKRNLFIDVGFSVLRILYAITAGNINAKKAKKIAAYPMATTNPFG